MESTDWDVNQYKTASECDEHWNLRLNFMLRWKDEIPEDRLVCLARVFANIEFLGCRYPAPVMRQVAELSKETAADYRKKKKLKLQRTFVSASDAAGDKAKGTHKRSNKTEEGGSKPKKMMFISAESKDTFMEPTKPNADKKIGMKRHNLRAGHDRNEKYNNSNITNKYGNLVLFQHAIAQSCISRVVSSCQACKVSLDWEFKAKNINNSWCCNCIINKIPIAMGNGETQKMAKDDAAKLSLQILEKECYTVLRIQTHHSKDDKTISVKEIGENTEKTINPLDVKVESKVAARMMKLMGWSGGGLGASANGINEPIAPNLKQIHRAGLGSSGDHKPIIAALRQIINDFKNNGTTDYDLVFANEFGKEERAEMHKLAQRNGLKSRSYGKDDDRYLVISKQMSPGNIVQTLLDCGGLNDKYQLIWPTK